MAAFIVHARAFKPRLRHARLKYGSGDSALSCEWKVKVIVVEDDVGRHVEKCQIVV